ncbi:MAG: hypothetical protein U1E05_12675, partial [Patescibacteria group bacterium]|nr:hypothetical protein [Patescibacteria group bacterium]
MQVQPVQVQPVQVQPVQVQPVQGQSSRGRAAVIQPVGQAGAGRLAKPVLVKGERDPKSIDTHESEEEPPEELTEVAIKNAPPWLVSAAVHMVILIILGLIMVVHNVGGQVNLEFAEDDIWAEDLGEQLEIDSPLGLEMTDVVEDPILTPDDLPEVPDPFATPNPFETQIDGTTATSDLASTQIGLALT